MTPFYVDWSFVAAQRDALASNHKGLVAEALKGLIWRMSHNPFEEATLLTDGKYFLVLPIRGTSLTMNTAFLAVGRKIIVKGLAIKSMIYPGKCIEEGDIEELS